MAKTVDDTRKEGSGFTARRIISLVFGILLGISGINHGFFEAMQGYKPTNGVIVQAIGEAKRMWPYGTEEAFTIVPNFLITGILAMCSGFAVIVWSIRFIHKRNGTLILLMLFIVLFLVGGGIAQVLFFLPIWAYSTRINKPLQGWKRVLSGEGGKHLSLAWKYFLAICSLLFVVASEIAIAGFFPGITKKDTLLYICWSFLAVSWILMNVTFISGFAADIANRERSDISI